jgi:chaperone modulatory protein CbpM
MPVYALARPARLSLATVARRSGLHPQLIERYVALGLVDADRDTTGHLWFAPTAPFDLARVQRLHAGLALNYTAIGVVLDLLDRIDELESILRASGIAVRRNP